ncbi:MAG: hypothetical protein J0L63_10905 [Anaerolineae bacterium]|nr:hypothetical protein [Anaerolineae bacterium]
MLRGFRWQFLVLVMALVLFLTSLASRTSNAPVPVAEPTLIPPTATTEVVVVPTALPEVTVPAVIAPANNAIDTIPTYREALVGRVGRLNPLFANLNPVDHDITSLIYEGLTRINEYGEPVPSLAKSWVISSDGLEYVVELREDILWQDGIAFNSNDVIYTMGILQDTEFPGDPALGAFWRTVEVQQLDTYLVRFRLTQSLGRFLDMLKIGILPEHALRGTSAEQLLQHPFNLSPIGTGPYQLEALRTLDGSQTQIVDLRAAPVYRQRPEGQSGYRVDRLSFHLFDSFESAVAGLQGGVVDGLFGRDRDESSRLMNLPGVNIYTTIEPTLGVLIFNWASDQTAYFREQRLRSALQMGLDRSSIIERIMGTEAIRADSPLIAGSWAYVGDLPWPIPDAGAARTMLQTVNIQRGGEATSETPNAIRFSILAPDDEKLRTLAQEVASQWSQLGIEVSVDVVDAATYQSRLDNGEFGAALVELAMGDSADPDVYQFWDADQYPDGKNFGGVDDRRIAEDLERGRSEPFSINRAIHYTNFQRNFITRAIAIPLYYPIRTYAIATDVNGVQLGLLASPASRFQNIQDWAVMLG